MISVLSWIPRGAAKSVPIKYVEKIDLDDEAELDNQETEEQMDESEEGSDELPPANKDDEFDLENYDAEDDDKPFAEDIESLLKYNPLKDPYITSQTAGEDVDDIDDFVIRDSDLVLVAGVSEDEEISHLDIYVYESVHDNLYIHHDYLLPAFPLCLAWLDYPVGSDDVAAKSNYLAVGTFEPYIEIWDLDVVDRPSPITLLGGPEDINNLDGKLTKDSHRDSVLGLSWNRNQRNALASASADCTVKLWDLNVAKCLKTYTHHTDKVQAVQWNPAEAPILASGGFDSKIIITDVRTADGSMSYKLSADVETIQWLPSPHHNHILVSTEDGLIYFFDIAKGLSQPVWRMQAHEKAVHSIAVNPRVPGLIATGSVDQNSPLKIWDISSGKPSCLHSKTAEVGPVFTMQFSYDEPFFLAVGSKQDKPRVVNTLEFPSVQETYAGFLQNPAKATTTNTEPIFSPAVFNATANQKSTTITTERGVRPGAQKNKKKGKGKGKGSKGKGRK